MIGIRNAVWKGFESWTRRKNNQTSLLMCALPKRELTVIIEIGGKMLQLIAYKLY